MKNIDLKTGEILYATRKITVEDSVTFQNHQGTPNGKFVMVYKESLRAFIDECVKKNMHFSECILLLYCLAYMNDKNEITLHYSESMTKLGICSSGFAKARKHLELLQILTPRDPKNFVVNCAFMTLNGRFAAEKKMSFYDFSNLPPLLSFDRKPLQIGIEPKLQKIIKGQEELQKRSEKITEFANDCGFYNNDNM